jgi:hypothetical protein
MLLRGNLTGIKVQGSVQTVDEAPPNEEKFLLEVPSSK